MPVALQFFLLYSLFLRLSPIKEWEEEEGKENRNWLYPPNHSQALAGDGENLYIRWAVIRNCKISGPCGRFDQRENSQQSKFPRKWWRMKLLPGSSLQNQPLYAFIWERDRPVDDPVFAVNCPGLYGSIYISIFPSHSWVLISFIQKDFKEYNLFCWSNVHICTCGNHF